MLIRAKSHFVMTFCRMPDQPPFGFAVNAFESVELVCEGDSCCGVSLAESRQLGSS
jgi:hypothetical protein